MTETCPMFFMRGDEIVEVHYMEWTTEDGGETWRWTKKTRLKIKGGADTLIVELPIGCFEALLNPTSPEGTLMVEFAMKGKSGDAVFQRCVRPRSEALESAEL